MFSAAEASHLQLGQVAIHQPNQQVFRDSAVTSLGLYSHQVVVHRLTFQLLDIMEVVFYITPLKAFKEGCFQSLKVCAHKIVQRIIPIMGIVGDEERKTCGCFVFGVFQESAILNKQSLELHRTLIFTLIRFEVNISHRLVVTMEMYRLLLLDW